MGDENDGRQINKRKSECVPEENNAESSKKRKKVVDKAGGTVQQLSTEGDEAKPKKKKKSKKNRESLEISESFVYSASANNSVDSNNVTPNLSITEAGETTTATKKKKSKKFKGDHREESAASTTTTAVADGDTTTAGPISSEAPVPPERKSKNKKSKKSKALQDAESTTVSDVDTPMKTAKNQFLTELKGKVKKREVAPMASPLPAVTKVAPLNDEVFATPKKADTTGAPPRIAMGQWGKVELGSTEKTQKFFRLLGGMKKPTGSPLSFRSSNGSTSTAEGDPIEPEKAIMAMGKKDADILNNKLEEQFKKALGGIGKGKVGLGF